MPVAVVVNGDKGGFRQAEVMQFLEGGECVANRVRLDGRALERRHEEQPDDFRVRVAELAKLVPGRVGGIDKHAAAGAASQPGDDVNARPIAAQPQMGQAIGLGRLASPWVQASSSSCNLPEKTR